MTYISLKTSAINVLQINESVQNLFESDKAKKIKYMDQVWSILQDAYHSQGGIKGSGFNSPEDMLNIPFWKLDVIDDEVLAIVMYKFKEIGTADTKVRKLVALGTKFDKERKTTISKKLYNIVKEEFYRSLFEISGLAEQYFVKNFPDLVKKYIKSFDEVVEILNDDELRKIDDYRYERKIGGHWHEKILLGTVVSRK